MTKRTTQKLVLTALFIAISFVGANLKVMSTIAFDSMAGFLAALLLGPSTGALVGAVGHFLTALTSGFPLSLPVHLAVMATMALTMWGFGVVHRWFAKRNSQNWALVLAVIVGTLLNGPVSLLLMSPLLVPIMGWAGILGMLPVLTLAGAANAVIAAVLFKPLEKVLGRWGGNSTNAGGGK